MLRQQITILVVSGCLTISCTNTPGGPGSLLDAGTNPSDDLSTVGDAGPGLDAQPPTDATMTTPINVTNPSFELPATGPGTFIVSGPPSGWQAYGSINNNNRSVGVLNPNSTTLYLDRVPNGNNVGVVFLLDNSMNQTYYANSPAGLQQTLTETLLANSEYTLSVMVGNLNVDNSPMHPYEFLGFPNYRVELLAGGQVLASDMNSLRPGEGRFLLSTVKFMTGSQHAQLGTALGIRLINLNSNIGIEVNFDDVKLERAAR